MAELRRVLRVSGIKSTQFANLVGFAAYSAANPTKFAAAAPAKPRGSW
jgi:hypothetical protein